MYILMEKEVEEGKFGGKEGKIEKVYFCSFCICFDVFFSLRISFRISSIRQRQYIMCLSSAPNFLSETLNLSKGKLICGEKEVSINGKELNLIEILLINKEQIIEKDTLTDKIWGYDSEAEYNTVEVYISFLRKKIKLLGSKVKISTIRGIGYKLEDKND